MIKALKLSFKNFFCDIDLTCETCGAEIFDDRHFCGDCYLKLPLNDKCICNHCGRQTAISYAFCIECKDEAGEYSRARSAFVYDSPVSSLINAFKDGGKKYLAEVFVDFLLPHFYRDFIRTDYLLYVPMFEEDEDLRGYNQSQLLAKELSEKTGVKTLEDVVEKVTKTERQKRLSRNERKVNLGGAFRIRKRKVISGKHLLILDDIFTTGATAEIISKKLLKAGAKSVGVLTIASVPFEKHRKS